MEGNETGGKETSWEAVEMKTTLAKIVQWGWREVDSFKKVDLTDVNEELVWEMREKVELRKTLPSLGLVPFIYIREHRRKMGLQRDGEGFSLRWVEFEIPENHVRRGVRATAGNADPKFRRACGVEVSIRSHQL